MNPHSVTRRPAWPMRRRLAALLLALATALTALGALPSARAAGARTYLVEAGTVLPASAEVLQELPLADLLLVRSPVEVPGAVPADTPVQPEALTVSRTAVPTQPVDSGVAATGAPQVWPHTRGEHAVVALVDTGVAPVPALEGAVAGEIDFSGTGGGDGYGHGTFLASLIAGRGPVAPGVAPSTGVLSLKVAGPDGSSTLGAVMTALEWLHGPGRSLGVRVASLAMGVEPGTKAAEVLDRGVDALARSGVLVVTAAGNEGPGALTAPATATGSLSVGSVDHRGTADRSDDVPTDFSSTGRDRAGVQQPDVVAPGVSLVGSLPPDSLIAGQAAPDPAGLYRGSGTSMSTALTAGVAALASSARPDLDGAQLDAALRAGGAQLDAAAAVSAALAAPSTGSAGDHPGKGNPGKGNPGNGNGNGKPGKGNGQDHPGKGNPGKGNPGKGNGNGSGGPVVDPESVRWTSVRWTSVRWTGAGWEQPEWMPTGLASARWTMPNGKVDPQSVRWTSIRWTSIRWTSVRWTSVRWTWLP